MPTTPAEPAAPPPAPPPPQGGRSRWRNALRGTGPMAAVVGLAVLLVLGAGEWATRNELDNQWDNLRRSGEVQALALRGVATRYSYLPFTAAQQPLIAELLHHPGAQSLRNAANAYLQAINANAGSDTLYVINTDGLTVASSNWDTPTSFVNQNYGNRPYFRDALQGQPGRFYGVGKTTGEPGLFASAPVVENGRVIGVVAVKVWMQPIVDTWAQLRDPVFVTDERGIVFLGSVFPWLYKTTRSLPEQDVQQVQFDEQYGARWAPQPVPWKTLQRDSQPGTEIVVPGTGKRYLAFEERLPDLGWTLTLTADSKAIALARQQAWALASLASGLLVLGALYWQLRERRLAENRQARIELEQRVHERTYALQQAQAFRQSMEDSLLVGMRARDLEGRIVYVNAAMCDMVGYAASELIGSLPPYPYWHPDDLDRHWNDSDTVLAGKASPQGRENRLRHRNGSDVHTMFYTTRLIDGNGQHIGWMSSVVDITAQKRAEEQQQQREAQLQRVQRVITVGEMASTLAHELNQPLAALVNYAAAARSLAAQGKTELLNDSLTALSAQALRAADIVGRIRRWVRQHPEAREPCDLNAAVDQSLGLLLRAEARRHGVAVRLDLAQGPLHVNADRVLLEQVVLNLGLNALQAMQTHATPPTEHELLLRTTADARFASLEVLDRGPGLAPEIAERLFEPFFTTRSDGLGLGLNICRSIVESMGGELRANNRDGGGAVFEIRLPRLSSPP
ncbi:PAS domain-containing sensor histidine kinase [Acidovorax sp. Root267]|uniref:sensor histidine kinase n=1 Tax=Acidovorax sp. Root267 TaxID=1736505 RepID=UPI00070E64C8|nr:PAS domain S-box protein [Acidovorax sp. Root267]KRD13600.1 PAS domain-containing sensor histidine kinase [Acidovorax sp. Root267]